jgi:hypothetical protein
MMNGKNYLSETATASVTNNTFINPAYATAQSITFGCIRQKNLTISGNIVKGEGEIEEDTFGFAIPVNGEWEMLDWDFIKLGFSRAE